MTSYAIGIDLGTTNSCVAYVKNNKSEILENAEGGRTTPSCVFYVHNQPGSAPVVGAIAKKMSDMQPENGIYEIKRLVGKRFNEIQDKLQYFAYDVERDGNDSPVVVINRQNETLKKTPQEICSLILTKLKKDAEDKLGQSVKNAVITVPAYFDSTQREITLAAAEAVGLNVLHLLTEPTAAALSYYYGRDKDDDGYTLVFDLGGGTFDVSVLKGDSKNLEIVCVDGDTNLGGRDLDNVIIDYVCEILEEKYDYNPKEDRRKMRRLQNACEETKRELSVANHSTIVLSGFVPHESTVTIDLSREEFERRAENLFQRTIDVISKCLERSKITKDEVREVILAGGSSRIPKIQQMVSEFFDGRELNKTLHLDECVAAGAAIQAAMLNNSPTQEIRKMQLIDVVPLSMGIGDWANKMIFIIKRNTPLPVTETKELETALDQQTSVHVKLYEGERLDVTKNHYLGDLTLTNITKAPPGEVRVMITLSIDKNGILKVTASEKMNENVKELSLNRDRSIGFDMKNVIADAAEDIEADKKFEEFANLKLYLLNYCEQIKYHIKAQNLNSKYYEEMDWCRNTMAKVTPFQVENFGRLEELVEETKEKCEPLVTTHHFSPMPKL